MTKYLFVVFPIKVCSGHSCSIVVSYLCDLSQGICWWDSLVAVDAVALNGVGALWRRVAWWHVGWGGC